VVLERTGTVGAAGAGAAPPAIAITFSRSTRFVTAVATPIAALLWGACAQVVGITATTAAAGVALIVLTSLTALLRADSAAVRRVRARFAAPGPATS
jgi:hypothetical protein